MFKLVYFELTAEYYCVITFIKFVILKVNLLFLLAIANRFSLSNIKFKKNHFCFYYK